MNNQPISPYKQASQLANIYQHTIDFENYLYVQLVDNNPELLNKLHRNTNSIKSIINKYLDTLAKQK